VSPTETVALVAFVVVGIPAIVATVLIRVERPA
jgi:hypothetical protein